MSVSSYLKDGITLYRYDLTLRGQEFSRSGFSDIESAMLAEAELVLSVLSPSLAITFGEVVDGYTKWYALRIKRSSLDKWQSRERLYFRQLPYDRPYMSIDLGVLESWWAGLGVGSSVLSRLNFDLRQISEFARIRYKLDNTDLLRLFVPKDYSIRHVQKRAYVLSVNDFSKMIAFEDKPLFRLLFVLAFVGGLRVGEVRGLCVDSFDFERGTMEIFRQVVNISTGQFLTCPKTDSSIRLVRLPRMVIDMVREYISENHLGGSLFLFSPRGGGKVIGETTIDRELHRLQVLAGLPRFPFHCFRRSEASLLNDCGLSGETISDYLGHSSFDTTRRFYLGDTDEKRDQILKIMEAKLAFLTSLSKK